MLSLTCGACASEAFESTSAAPTITQDAPTPPVLDGGGGQAGAAPASDAGAEVEAADDRDALDAPADTIVEVDAAPRCDWIPVCATDPAPCALAYSATCGTVRSGTFACGELRGYAFDDGTSYACDDTGCGAAAGRAAAHCSDVSS